MECLGTSLGTTTPVINVERCMITPQTLIGLPLASPAEDGAPAPRSAALDPIEVNSTGQHVLDVHRVVSRVELRRVVTGASPVRRVAGWRHVATCDGRFGVDDRCKAKCKVQMWPPDEASARSSWTPRSASSLRR